MKNWNIMKLIRISVCLMLLGVVSSTLVALGSNWIVDSSTNADVFQTVSELPENSVGLVLGCSRYVSDGRENLFFKYRINQAAALFNSGKIEKIIVSGDNSRIGYDEPSDMRDALIEHGVPSERIHLDYAGFSTLDSIVRAKEVFQQSELIVISQEFHVRRAVYIGKSYDMNIVGSTARDVRGHIGMKTHAREYLARVKTLLDIHVFRRGPKFLGETIDLNEAV